MTHNEIVTFQDMNGAWKPFCIQSVNEPRLSKYLYTRSCTVCVVLCQHMNVGQHTNTHTSFLLITHLCSITHMQANTCNCASTYTHIMHGAIRYRAADSFGLILSSYSDRLNKSEQCTVIHFHYPWPEAFNTVGSRSRVGLMYLLPWHQTWQGSTILTLLDGR